ncbi:putative repeat protein (TIGR03943 family) [Micromonospora pisi]|uniref:Putative repeat protein (TIGR03943 family) n=1 Tax=Micromonospora pisi TaxID=589240 RepID=A0A495JF83_9ACTN|nr:TIGR03943 family protein [Micromonospora pisi]RKR87680.1 putative repeat protein (TIGR03943 family) [Micromonospora pisi]
MNRQAQAVVLLLLGGAVLKASFTEMYLRYVKEGLRPFLIASAILLIVAAVMTLLHDLRPATRANRGEPDGDHHESHGDDHGHDHGGKGHHEPRVGWLLILPVLGLLLVAPPALGSYAADQAGTALGSQPLSDYPPLPDGDPVKLPVLDYASRAIFDKGASLGDRRVQLTGFVATGANGEPILARMILSCCAADGRPIKLGLAGEAPTGLAPDTWVEVVGRYSDKLGRDPVNDAEIPYLDVESWRQVEAPKQPYE